MTSNPSITAEVRSYLSDKYSKYFPPKPAAQVDERRAECPINNEDTREVEEEVEKVIEPRVRVAKVKAIGVHTAGQEQPRRTGVGYKLPSLKLQPTGIISPVPYAAWKLDANGDRMPSVCTRKGNGLGNLGESAINYQATKAKYVSALTKRIKSELSWQDNEEYAANQAELVTVQHHKDLNAAMATADKKAAKRERQIDRALKVAINVKTMFEPVWSGPTGGEATTPNRDTTPVKRGPKTNMKSVGKRKNRKGYTNTNKPKAVTLVHVVAKTHVEVRSTADEKAVAKLHRAEVDAHKMYAKRNKHAVKLAAQSAEKKGKL